MRLATAHPWHLAAGTLVATVVMCALLFYLTPLRFVNPIDPFVRDIDSAALYAKMQAHPERYFFIDVRTAATYQKEHAVGAINIPIHDLYDDRFALPKRGKTIVLICGDGELAGVAYGYLEHYGFLNLARIEGGLAAWKVAGLPTEAAASSSPPGVDNAPTRVLP